MREGGVVEAARPQPGFMQTQAAFAAHIRDPEHQPPPAGIEDRRMAIYRDLFFSNVSTLLETNFPVLRKLLPDAHWRDMIRDFLIRHRCHTPLFLELPQEFLDYLGHERDANSADPPFLLELAHYEWVELALSVSDDQADPNVADPNGDLMAGIPVVSPLAWNLSYRYPVHRIGPNFQPGEANVPAPDQGVEQRTHLLAYRNRQDRVEFMEINAVTQRLLQLLHDNPHHTGLETVTAIAAELEHPDPAKVIAAGRSLLHDLRARNVIIGTRRVPPPITDPSAPASSVPEGNHRSDVDR
jgi:hypothetical protein